jgi:RNA recognition motif-containing protein
MAISLYLGNLPPDATESEVEGLVCKYDRIVSIRLIPPKCIAFVAFANKSAIQAVKDLNLIQYGGRTLHVAESMASQKSRGEGRISESSLPRRA